MKHWGTLTTLTAAALLFAAPAHADIHHDLQFVRAINEAGLTYDTEENLVAMGHSMCQALDNGATYINLIQIMNEDAGTDPLTGNIIASTAVKHLCPEYWTNVFLAQIELPKQARII